MDNSYFDTDPKYDKMRNVLTGELLSQEMKAALTKFSKGMCVSENDINNIPEVKEALNKLKEIEESFNIDLMSPERIQKRREIFEKLQNALPSDRINHERRLDIIIGLPAAGKSSALAEPIAEFYKSRIVDSDEAKKQFDEFKGGWGAGVVHPESQTISDQQLYSAISNGENISYPRVGGDCDELKKYIRYAKQKGYKVFVHYNELDRNKALGRMLERFLTTGRFLKPELITKYDDKIDKTYRELRNSDLIDGFSKWNNDVPFGKPPKLVEYSSSCGDFCEKRLRDFQENLEEIQTNLQAQLEKKQAELLASNAELEKYKNTPQAISIQAAEKFKAERNILLAKLNEVSEVFKQLPPEFTKAYVQKRKELRGLDPPTRDGDDRTKPKPPKPKKPKH